MPELFTFSRKAKKLIEAFEQAVDALAFKGASHPDEHDEIDANYAEERNALEQYIAQLERK